MKTTFTENDSEKQNRNKQKQYNTTTNDFIHVVLASKRI